MSASARQWARRRWWWRRSTTVALLAAVGAMPLAAVSSGVAATATHAASVPRTALINADSITLQTGILDSSGTAISLEQFAAQHAGFTVTVVTGAEWDAMTAAQFAGYQLLIVGDPLCSDTPASVTSNAATWAPVVMGTSVNSVAGNRTLVGTDPEDHYAFGAGGASPTNPADPTTAGAEHLVEDGITFAGAVPGATGVYFDTSCTDPGNDLAVLNSLSVTGTGFTENTNPPCGGSVQLIAANAAFATLTDADIQGWECSDHITFPTFPSDWQPLAVATDTATTPTCGTDPDTLTTACGEAYVLLAGQSVVVTAPDLSLAPATGTDPVGGTHTVTATVTRAGSPLAGQLVTFTITGQNTGVSGTCNPVSCQTDAAGQVTFSYPDTNGAGTDTINASADLAGVTEHATAAETWTAGTAPAASVSPARIDFGTQPTATASGAQTVTVTSTGGAPLTISALTVAGANAAEFTISADGCSATSLAPGASCTFAATFAPTALGPASASVSIADNAADSPQRVDLSGTGVAAGGPAAAITPPVIDFGSLPVGAASAPQLVTLTSTGGSPLVVGAPGIFGAGAGEFGITQDSCAGATLAPGQSCSFAVIFVPNAVGGAAATVAITDNAATSPETVGLSGIGTAPGTPAVTVNPASLSFGPQMIGTVSGARTVRVTSLGSGQLLVGRPILNGGGQFFVVADRCAGAALAPGRSCTFAVMFAPRVVGPATGSVVIPHNAGGGALIVGLSGAGVNPTLITPTAAPAPPIVIPAPPIIIPTPPIIIPNPPINTPAPRATPDANTPPATTDTTVPPETTTTTVTVPSPNQPVPTPPGASAGPGASGGSGSTAVPGGSAGAPALRLGSPSGVPGGNVVVGGAGCQPGAPVRLLIEGQAAGTTVADATGAFNARVQVPSLSVGTHVVEAQCGGLTLPSPLMVVLSTASASTPSSLIAAVLAFFILIGLILLLLRPRPDASPRVPPDLDGVGR